MKDLSDLPIVVVEDDPLTLSLFAALLDEQGFKSPILFDNSRKALDFLTSADAALIILDLNLPDISGQDLLRHVGARNPQIPVVVITGVHQIDTAIECMQLGAVDYVTKPFSVQRFAESLTRALEFRRAKEEARGGSAPKQEKVPERLSKAAAYMEQNLSRPLYLDTIAQEACLSKFHFCRAFKRFYGVTPIQFVLQRRIAQAASLLQGREISISEVAMQSGFSDQSEFTKWFKKVTGFTPSRYRKSRQSSAPVAAAATKSKIPPK